MEEEISEAPMTDVGYRYPLLASQATEVTFTNDFVFVTLSQPQNYDTSKMKLDCSGSAGRVDQRDW